MTSGFVNQNHFWRLFEVLLKAKEYPNFKSFVVFRIHGICSTCAQNYPKLSTDGELAFSRCPCFIFYLKEEERLLSMEKSRTSLFRCADCRNSRHLCKSKNFQTSVRLSKIIVCFIFIVKAFENQRNWFVEAVSIKLSYFC